MKRAPVILIVVGLLGLSGLASGQVDYDCRALAESDGDIFLTTGGTGFGSVEVIQALPDTIQPENHPTLSPDGSRIAYVLSGNALTVAVRDATGFTISFSADPRQVGDLYGTTGSALGLYVPPEARRITQLLWTSKDVLRVGLEAARGFIQFVFLKVPNTEALRSKGLSAPVSPVRFAQELAYDCRDTPDSHLMACAYPYGISLAGSNAYGVENIDRAAPIATATGRVDIPFRNVAGPEFSFLVRGVQSSAVGTPTEATLRVTLPNGEWSEQRIAPGSLVSVGWDDSFYAFDLSVQDANSGNVSVRTYRELGSHISRIAWVSTYLATAPLSLAVLERRAEVTTLKVMQPSATLPLALQAVSTARVDMGEPIVDMLSTDQLTSIMLVTPTRFVLGALLTNSIGTVTAAVGLPDNFVISSTIARKVRLDSTRPGYLIGYGCGERLR